MTTIDITDENYRILSQYFSKTDQFSPTIPLGARGELMGRRWEIIGFLVRMDTASSFTWNEYLLFNPYYGYRWLTENSGHWSFVTPIKDRPSKQFQHSRTLTFRNEHYQLYYDGRAEVLYVLGEFYWLVQVGKNVQMRDYVNPPKMLSQEEDANEIQWALSDYIEPDVVRKAFNLKEIPAPQSVAANQPSPWIGLWRDMGILWFLFFVVLTGLEVWQVASATSQNVLRQSYPFTTNQKSVMSITTPVFTLNKDSANVQLDFNAGVDNSWLYVSGELVNDKTGETYSFDRSIEYYHGVDSDGAWTEGSQSASVLLPAVPGGRYYINLDSESGGYPVAGQSKQFGVVAWRNVPTYANYLWCLLGIALLPCFSWWRKVDFETRRWSNSDYRPYMSSD